MNEKKENEMNEMVAKVNEEMDAMDVYQGIDDAAKRAEEKLAKIRQYITLHALLEDTDIENATDEICDLLAHLAADGLGLYQGRENLRYIVIKANLYKDEDSAISHYPDHIKIKYGMGRTFHAGLEVMCLMMVSMCAKMTATETMSVLGTFIGLTALDECLEPSENESRTYTLINFLNDHIYEPLLEMHHTVSRRDTTAGEQYPCSLKINKHNLAILYVNKDGVYAEPKPESK